MPEWISPAIAGAALFVSLATTLAGRGQATERRLVTLETKVELMFRDVSFAAAFAATSTLHREDDGHRLDALIDKFRAGTLTRDDLVEFVKRLRAVENSGQAHEREAAEVLLRILGHRYGV